MNDPLGCGLCGTVLNCDGRCVPSKTTHDLRVSKVFSNDRLVAKYPRAGVYWRCSKKATWVATTGPSLDN